MRAYRQYRPWFIRTATAFRSRESAAAFEKYMKAHSGRVFASRRLFDLQQARSRDAGRRRITTGSFGTIHKNEQRTLWQNLKK